MPKAFYGDYLANTINPLVPLFVILLREAMFMATETRVEIISVGNELLIGKILNTNAQFLAKRVTMLGMKITRVTTIADSVDEIAKTFLEALPRKPRFVIITGGLGPTFDDMTLEGVAKALNRRLEVNAEALGMVKERYDSYVQTKNDQTLELTPPRVKMATIPEKTEPIRNPVGTAPAVRVNVGKTVVFLLPGVPREMEAIFEETIAPLLNRASTGSAFHEDSIYVSEIMESTIAPLIDSVMHSNPSVYIKSHPKGAESKPSIEIHFSITAAETEKAKEKLQAAKEQLSRLITENSGKINGTQSN